MGLARTVARQLDLRLDEVLDVDLGELVRGVRVHALGLAHGAERTDLHYAFVPAIGGRHGGGFGWLWELHVQDDAGTDYTCQSGAFDGRDTGAWSHGQRDIVPTVPAEAGLVTLAFRPAPGWGPGTPWVQRLELRRQPSRRRPLDVRVHRGR